MKTLKWVYVICLNFGMWVICSSWIISSVGIQQGQVQLQQQQTPVVASSQNVVCSTGNISGSGVAVSSSVDSKSSVADITGGTSNQLPGSTGRQASVSPYALHINLMTSSGHGKPLPQLQPITTSALAAASAKSPTFLPLQLPAKLLLASANILTTKTVKSEPSTPLTLGEFNMGGWELTYICSLKSNHPPFYFGFISCSYSVSLELPAGCPLQTVQWRCRSTSSRHMGHGLCFFFQTLSGA